MSSNRLTLEQALAAARETKGLRIGQGILGEAPAFYRRFFDDSSVVIVADTHTYRAAGAAVDRAFRAEHSSTIEPFLFHDEDLYAEHTFVERLEKSFQSHAAIPIAVGSGTINDLVKLAAHRTHRPYLCVATAASMDGYTAYGASITYRGSKQTFDCPAPRAVLADLDVIASAPTEMKAWGYADLLAKVTAGADWILADLLGIEPIDRLAWDIIQGGLRDALADPVGVRSGDALALGKLVESLMLGGFAMQAARSSRPASGAEHQFSHLWDMQHHTHQGRAPSHGQKVGIGTLAITAFYESLLRTKLTNPSCLSHTQCDWPSREAWIQSAISLFDDPELQVVAIREIDAKFIDAAKLLEQRELIQRRWPEILDRLSAQLIPFATLKSMLVAVGASTEPEQIGISRTRLKRTFRQAFYVRRRFTVLDLAVRLGILDDCVDSLFAPHGTFNNNR